jgi:hypothetical protein
MNRFFGGKPGGLIVDYLRLVENLCEALAIYTQQGMPALRISVLMVNTQPLTGCRITRTGCNILDQ